MTQNDKEGQAFVPPYCLGKGAQHAPRAAGRQRGTPVLSRDKERYMEDFFQVGIITSTHGVRGEVKVFPTTDDARRFKRLKSVILDSGKERVSMEIEEVKFLKQFVVLKFKGIDDINEAEKYRKCSLFVERKDAVRLGRDEYFVADLEGLTVRNEDGTEIGVLKSVMETGANDVYVIALNDGRELLLPAIKQCVLDVDVEAGFIRIHILDGLLDGEGQQ